MIRIRELLVDLYGCNENLDNTEFLVDTLKRAALNMGSTIVKVVTHDYKPEGSTVLVILAETHISIHTWPEYQYAALDIFVCKEEINPEMGWIVIKGALQPASFKLYEMQRRIK